MREVVPVQKGLYRVHTIACFTVYVYNSDVPGSHPGFWFLTLVTCHGALSTRELKTRTGALQDALHMVLITGFFTGSCVNPNSEPQNENQEQCHCAKSQEDPSCIWYETFRRRRNEPVVWKDSGLVF